MSNAAPPATRQRSDFHTSDPDEAHQWIRSSFTDYHSQIAKAPPGFEFRGAQTDTGRYTVSRLVFPMAARLAVPPMKVIVVTHTLSGWFGYRDSRDEVRAFRDETILFPYQGDLEVRWDRMDIGAVALRPEEVARIASELTGIAPDDLHFSGGTP